MFDYFLLQHEFKKVRNSLIKSGDGRPKKIVYNFHSVSWKHFLDAYEWDQANCPKQHQKLTSAHINPDQGEKMRNKLANDVLNAEMLALFEVCLF